MRVQARMSESAQSEREKGRMRVYSAAARARMYIDLRLGGRLESVRVSAQKARQRGGIAGSQMGWEGAMMMDARKELLMEVMAIMHHHYALARELPASDTPSQFPTARERVCASLCVCDVLVRTRALRRDAGQIRLAPVSLWRSFPSRTRQSVRSHRPRPLSARRPPKLLQHHSPEVSHTSRSVQFTCHETTVKNWRTLDPPVLLAHHQQPLITISFPVRIRAATMITACVSPFPFPFPLSTHPASGTIDGLHCSCGDHGRGLCFASANCVPTGPRAASASENSHARPAIFSLLSLPCLAICPRRRDEMDGCPTRSPSWRLSSF